MYNIQFSKVPGDSDFDKFNKALQLAKASQDKSVTIKFDKGTYHFHKYQAHEKLVHLSNTDSVQYPYKKIGVLIEDIDNLIIDGQGSLFNFHGNMMMFAIMNSQNITLKNIVFDYQVSTTSEMTVVGYDKQQKWIDYKIPNSLPYEIKGTDIYWLSEKDNEGNYYWIEKNAHKNYGIQVKYPQKQMGRSYYSEDHPFQNIINIVEKKNHILRFNYDKMPPIKPEIGMNYQFLSNAQRETAGAFIYNSQNITLENVQIAYMHGFGLLVQMSEDVVFDKIKLKTRAETERNTSSFADGIHVSGAKGEIVIKNSIFDNTHDDPINIHGTFTRVERKQDDYTLELAYVHAQQGGFTQYHIGDSVKFYSRDQLKPVDKSYTVAAVLAEEDKKMVIRFEEKLPDYIDHKIDGEGLYVVENQSYTPKVTIKNNHFSNVFTRMILVSTNKPILIENNYFSFSTMASIFISNDSNEWYESGPVNDVVIRNNIFNIKSIGRTYWKYAPAIYFMPVTKGGGLPDYQNTIHNNILIEDNEFYLESDGVLRAESVGNLTFRNNRVLRLNPNIYLQLPKEIILSLKEIKDIPLSCDSSDFQGEETIPNGPENNSGTNGNLFEFNACNTIKIENNFYDEGLKPYVLFENMLEDEIDISDLLRVVDSRKDRPVVNEFKNIYYEIDNHEILSIDQNKIHPHLVGQTTIRACYIYNDEIIKSNTCVIKVKEN